MTWHKIGYRTRWIYLLAIVLGWLFWYAMFLEPTMFGWRDGPVSGFVNLMAAYWTEDYGSWGLPIWWGLLPLFVHYDHGYYTLSSTVTFAGSFVLPISVPELAGGLLVLLLIGSVVMYVGITRRSTKQLPAMRRPGRFAAVSAGLMVSLLATAVVFALVMVEWFHDESLMQRIENSVARPSQQQWSRRTGHVEASTVRAVSLLVLALGVPVCAYLAQRFAARGRRYWRMERLTRGIALAAVGVWLAHLPILGISAYDEETVVATVTFACLTTLLWAATCRVILLFRLQRFYKAQASMGPECPACGYDLRGSPGGAEARCPECGVPAARDAPG